MKPVQTNKYISILGYKFYYVRFFLFKIAKPLKLDYYKKWKHNKNYRTRVNRIKNGGISTPNVWRPIMKKLLIERYGEKCRICKSTERLEIDHKIPLWKIKSKKGNKLGNLQLLCRDCHIEKTRKEKTTV